MALRVFTAPDGDEWRVWQVIPTPRLRDGRGADRRVNDVGPLAGAERRLDEPRFVEPHLAGGWLCFESDREKRRLAPPPTGWDTRTDAELSEFWARAEPAPKNAAQALLRHAAANPTPD